MAGIDIRISLPPNFLGIIFQAKLEMAAMVRTFGLVFLVAFVLMLVPAGLVTAQDQALELDLAQLAIDYNENELAANLKYRDKTVKLTVVISHINSNSLFERQPSASTFIGTDTVRSTLRLFFSGDQMEALVPALDSLVNEKPMTVICLVAGKKGLDVKLIDCAHQVDH